MSFLDKHQVKSIEELTEMLNLYTEKAVENAIEIAKKKLIEYINEDIYNNGKSEWYERLNDINQENNWELNIDHRYNKITVNLHFNDSALGHHGMGKKILDAQGLFAVLNDPQATMDMSCNLSLWYDYPHAHFWDDFQDWMRDNFMSLVKTELNGDGIKTTT